MTPFLLLLLAAAQAAPPPPPPPMSAAGLISQDDYPADSRRNGEHGTVAVRLDITAEGRVGACTVIDSSGFANLDAATCRLLSRRARFRPARDRAGNAVPDSLVQRITWRLADSPRVDAAMLAWRQCLVDGMAAASATSAAPETAANALLDRCAAQEGDLLAGTSAVPGSGPATSQEARSSARPVLIERIAALRSERRR